MLLSPNGEWTLFTGDQLGSIFASQVLQAYKTSGKPIDKLAMVASTVSSKMIESMAKIEGFKFTECLTGAPHCPLPDFLIQVALFCRVQVHWQYCFKPSG
jgi:phosphomannomutase